MRAWRPASEEQPGEEKMTQPELRQRLIEEMKDESGKLTDPDDFDNAIETALKEYSKHDPAELVVDINGSGTHDQDLPAGWIGEFSLVKTIEYPLGEVPASLLDSDDHEIYQTPAGDKLRLLNESPGITETLRIKFTVLRTVPTVPSKNIEAFILLAASCCCDKLANAWLQNSDSTIAADSVDYRSKSREAASRANSLRKRYREQMGLKDGDVTSPASAVIDLDYKYPGGGSRLTHRRKGRENR